PDFYVPGGQLDIEMQFDVTGPNPPAALNALGLFDKLPSTTDPTPPPAPTSNWSLDLPLPNPTDPNNPQVGVDVAHSTGTLSFAWFTIPALPFSYHYRINIPADATGVRTLDAHGTYRFATGGGIDTNHQVLTLTQQPCLSFDRPVPGTAANYSYAPG